MTLELIEILIDAALPLLAAVGLFLFKQLLATRDIELTVAGEEAARLKITAAIERIAGAVRGGESYDFDDAVDYVESRMKESLETLGMTTKQVQETLSVEIQRQTATATLL